MSTFYCKQYTELTVFDDKEQKKITKDLTRAGMSEMEIFSYIYPGSACEKQCDICINEMLDNRSKTQKLVEKLNNRNV